MAPTKSSGTLTSVLPVWQVIWFSAFAASTSGGSGGVQADSASTASAMRTMPRVMVLIRGIVLILLLILC